MLLLTGAMNTCLGKTISIRKSLEYLLATGNLVSKTGLGLMQVMFVRFRNKAGYERIFAFCMYYLVFIMR